MELKHCCIVVRQTNGIYCVRNHLSRVFTRLKIRHHIIIRTQRFCVRQDKI